MSQKDAFLEGFGDLVLDQRQREPMPCTFPPATADDPEFEVLVKVQSPEEMDALQRQRKLRVGGARTNNAAEKKERIDFLTKYVGKVFETWTGFTIRNFNSTVSPTYRMDVRDEGVAAKIAAGDAHRREGKTGPAPDEIPFSVANAVKILRWSPAENFDAPIYKVVQQGVEEELIAQGEDEIGSGDSA